MSKKAIVVALAAAIAMPMEGLRQYAYRDPVGIPTICYGSTKGVRLGDYKTLAECKELFTREMEETVARIDRCVPGLPDNVLAAFADAAYNVGDKIACDPSRSTAAKYLKAGKFKEACYELLKWDKARVSGNLIALPGLTKRRQMEKELCLTGLE